jgi:Rrf2 family transcriptional regulator, cysteine metabolism repressor
MKLSRTVAYGVQATLQLARSNSSTPVPCSQLAAEGHMPERFLLQILRHLVTHGILHSTRGVDGGYNLERSPEEISLLELIEAIDGPLHSTLPVGEGIPLQYDAKLRDALESITQTARQQLAAIKLSDLLEPPANSGGLPAKESAIGEEDLRSQDWPTAMPEASRSDLPEKHGNNSGNGGNYSGNAAGSEFQERHPT